MPIGFRPATEADFDHVLDLSIRTMRAHLERIGRFDPARRRARMRQHFEARSLRLIERDGTVIGCLGLYDRGDRMELHSFFLEPALQGRGVGAEVFAALRASHPGRGWWIEVLKESPARRFWERQGFVLVGEQPHDWIMERGAD
ncbi:GNAT family N-acetyltransferase [Falsiroseomonas oryzae]|uniref:GNAT family N-acetyltransferase n=1 Tax=Falsiroseomonas oryzae TaxID=2766473 RepID=UPI0022EAD3CC|nr:GNAT family N-acetyltransferase [Roseomonas sp. MO-31]